MGIYKYLALRTINIILVIIIALTLTYILFFEVFREVQIKQIEQSVRLAFSQNQELLSRFATQEELERAIKAQISAEIKSRGLDKPWYMNLDKLWKIFQFDFGKAWVITSEDGSTRDVRVIIGERLPRSILLIGSSVLITLFLGLALGLYAANRPQSFLDKSVIVTGLTANAFAAWWVGMILQWIFAYQLRWFPALGVVTADPPLKLFGGAIIIDTNTSIGNFIDVVSHLILPLSSLVLVSFGGWALVVRNLLISTLAEDFVSVARSKGVPENKILFGHALKSAAPPIITIVVLALTGLFFGGAIITETIFQWYGLGMLIWEAILNQDIPLIMAFFYISTILVVIANFIADIIYGLFDPRVKTG